MFSLTFHNILERVGKLTIYRKEQIPEKVFIMLEIEVPITDMLDIDLAKATILEKIAVSFDQETINYRKTP
jgi:hypothetical protein